MELRREKESDRVLSRIGGVALEGGGSIVVAILYVPEDMGEVGVTVRVRDGKAVFNAVRADDE